MPGPHGEDDGVDPDQQHEDDDEDLCGGEGRLGDPSLVQGREQAGLVGHLQLTPLKTQNINEVQS